MKGVFFFATLVFFLSSLSEAHGPEASGPGGFGSTHPPHLAETETPSSVDKPSATPSGTQHVAPLPEWEIRTAPVAFIAKWLTADLSYTLDKQFSLGPSMIIYNGPDDGGHDWFVPDYTGYAVGLNAMYYFRTIERRTGYLSLHLYYDKFTNNHLHSYREERSQFSGFKGTVAWGFRWRMAGWLTMLVGGGIEYRHRNERQVIFENNVTTVENYVDAQGYPFVEYKIGVLF